MGVEEAYRWKDSVQSAAEIRLWVADGVANGLRPWFTKFAGALHDRALARSRSRTSTAGTTAPSATCGTSGRSPAWASSIRSRPPGSTAADAGQANASRTTRSAGTRRSSRRASPSRWSTTACSTPSHLAAFKTLILPNIAALSDGQCAQLREFVERGGGLVATYETSLYDESGRAARRLRPGRPLRRLLRRHAARARCATPTCASSTTRARGGIRCCAGLEDAPRIIHGAWQLEVDAQRAVPEPAA